MPFTASHAAAVLPLHTALGPRVDLVALVVGSFAPDFPYYVGGAFLRASTHTPAAILWFCLPAGLAVFWLYERFLRRGGHDLLPRPLRARAHAIRPERPRALPVILGIALGAATHVAWDAFTHQNAFVRALGLDWHLATLGGYRVFSYKVLQHGSTFAGALVLLLALRRWLHETPARRLTIDDELARHRRLRARLRLLVAAPAFGLVVAVLDAPPVVDLTTLAFWVAHVLVAGIAAAIGIVALHGVRLARSEAPERAG